MLSVKTVSELSSQGITPDILFWVGCAGSFDQRAQKITKSFAKILQHCNINFAILGTEESCTGDPAKRAGNEFLFQMQAANNISVLNGYNIKKIVTTCPHCYNTFKNEYPQLGGNYEIIHHTQLLNELIESGKLRFEGGDFKGKTITYHDSCYLGRANGEYTAPRNVLKALDSNLSEMKRCKSNGFCCGAGGSQLFKESEKGISEVNIDRTNEALNTGAEIIAVNCPFCITMLSDGVKNTNNEEKVEVLDIAELAAQALRL
ncbi:MAG: (Fe-S)-binding protein [Bacteroidia bacterium]|nr:(Fe-S)-binding protein [Bacteroidia bacterium]